MLKVGKGGWAGRGTRGDVSTAWQEMLYVAVQASQVMPSFLALAVVPASFEIDRRYRQAWRWGWGLLGGFPKQARQVGEKVSRLRCKR